MKGNTINSDDVNLEFEKQKEITKLMHQMEDGQITEDEFNETIDTLNKIKFSKIHVFPYSRRKGTPADLMDNQIDEDTKKDRIHKLLALTKTITKEKNIEVLKLCKKKNMYTILPSLINPSEAPMDFVIESVSKSNTDTEYFLSDSP